MTTPDVSPSPTSENRSRGKRLLRLVPVVLVFVLIALAGLYRAPEMSNYPPEVRDELQKLEDRRDSLNFVFVGSSYTGYHLQLPVVAQAAAEQGVDLDPGMVYLHGMEMFEADAAIDEVLKLDLPELRWIGLEYRPWDPGALEDFYNTKRLTWWQRPERTGRLIKIAWAEAADDGDRDDAFPVIIRVGYRLLLNYSRVGQRTEKLDTEFKDRETADYMAYRNGPGKERIEADIAEKVRKHRERRERNEGWDTPDDSRYDRATARAYADQVRQVRDAGIELLYIVHASLIEKGVRPEAPVIDLDDPAAHPDLFKPENRVDKTHMMEDLFTPYSELVGREVAKLIQSESVGEGSD